jgi:hypothetical protein
VISWVLSSNPTTTYLAVESLKDNDGVMDWISSRQLAIGDVVYVYETLSGGRGGIIYRTIVMETDLTMNTKIDDRKYWIGGDYPEYITEATKFNRLKLAGIPTNGIIPYRVIRGMGFTAPQKGVYSLDEKQNLLRYIEGCFDQI